MEQKRLFIAIELPEDIKRDLGRLQIKLKQNGLESLKYTVPESLHITLKFLGYTSPELILDLATALDRISGRFDPFAIGIKGLGTFPSLSRPQVLWVGLSGELGRLQMIAREVEEELVNFGFKREKRSFAPHLTIARVRQDLKSSEQQTLAKLVSDATFITGSFLRINSLSLMQSKLMPVGAEYTRLHLAKLNANKAK